MIKYFTLTNSEIKKLLNLRKEHFLLYMLTLMCIFLSSYFLLQLIIRTSLTVVFAVFFTIVYTTYVVYTNRKYLKEIIYKQKKVYRGAVSFKIISKNKKGKYIFNVDGYTFYVDREDFESIQEGDLVDFHVSSSTKHLYRVEKVEE